MRQSKLNMSAFLNEVDERHGDRVFYRLEEPLEYERFSGGSFSFRDSVRMIDSIANGMHDRLGVRRGDKVAIVLTNGPEFGVFAGAAMRLGAVVVPFNYMHKAEELGYGVNDCGAKVMVTERELFDWNIGKRSALPGIDHWVMTGPKAQVPDGFVSVDVLTEGCPDSREPVSLSPDDVVGIFYTSGTTGWPKGAMLTSRNLLVPVSRATRLLHVTHRDRAVVALPLAHIFGFVCLLMAGLLRGASGSIMRTFDPRKTLEMIERDRSTIFVGVPAMYNMMLNEPLEEYDLSSIRLWISGADAMPVEQIERFESISGRFIEGYGLVETSSLVSVNLPFIRKAGSLGIPVLGVSVKIMDEWGNFLPKGAIGEIAVKGSNVMRGYWNNEEANRRAFAKGYFRTGDIGKMDRLRYIYFLDRAKDVITRRGRAIYSREVEEMVRRNPHVFECALVGAPDPEEGEVPVAFVQLKEGVEVTAEELLVWCRDNIEPEKAPARVEFAPTLPKTMTLKVLKRELRQMLYEQ